MPTQEQCPGRSATWHHNPAGQELWHQPAARGTMSCLLGATSETLSICSTGHAKLWSGGLWTSSWGNQLVGQLTGEGTGELRAMLCTSQRIFTNQ